MIKNRLRNIILKYAAYYFNDRASKVVFYHDLHLSEGVTKMSTPLFRFEKHLSVFRTAGFNVVADIGKERGEVKIQFDDGFKGIYDCLPFLKEHNIPVELFIITNKIGEAGYLMERQVKELAASGVVQVSCHTHTHPELGKCTDEEVRYELKTSKAILEDIIQRPVSALCYPKGNFSNKVVSIAKELGFTAQYSSLPGSFSQEVFPEVYRRNLLQYASISEVKSVLKGAHQVFYKKYWNQQFVG